MSSGARQLVTNLGERAVSPDQNRAQALANAEVGETLRYMLDVACGTDDVQAAGTTTEVTTSTSPMTGEVLNGLCVLPQIGTLNLLVSPGVLLGIDPDVVVSADDSPYKYVRDPGIQALGSLVLATNPSGNPVIGVVEVSRQTTALETDTRDVFNATTGLYAATTVTKVSGSTLVYRVRYGGSGTGFPGTATGWLPLAVVLLPSGSTTCDQCTFWDVRPLVTDRAFGPGMNVGLGYPRRLRGVVNGTTTVVTGGIFEVVGPDGRRWGGTLASQVLTSDAQTFNPNNASAQDPTLTGSPPANGALVTVCLVCPFGLPRWARYTTFGSGARKPRSPRGILVVTAARFGTQGTLVVGQSVTLPTGLGFNGATTTNAVALYEATWNTTGPVVNPVRGSEKGGYLVDSGFPSVVATGTSAGIETFTLVAGVNFPAGAKELCVRFNLDMTPAGAGANFTVCFPGGPSSGTPDNQVDLYEYAYFAAGNQTNVFTRWVPIASDYPANDQNTYLLNFGTGNGGDALTGASCTASVVGWRY
jgi:hypothetical protein